ncbi:Uncharacterised protein [Achromobacter xylosoxidans]|nr:Uncharacterised protein [Achromobacter xylosoxidans]
MARMASRTAWASPSRRFWAACGSWRDSVGAPALSFRSPAVSVSTDADAALAASARAAAAAPCAAVSAAGVSAVSASLSSAVSLAAA